MIFRYIIKVILENLPNINKYEEEEQPNKCEDSQQFELNAANSTQENMDTSNCELDEISRFNSFAQAINNGPPVAPSLYARFVSSGYHEGFGKIITFT